MLLLLPLQVMRHPGGELDLAFFHDEPLSMKSFTQINLEAFNKVGVGGLWFRGQGAGPALNLEAFHKVGIVVQGLWFKSGTRRFMCSGTAGYRESGADTRSCGFHSWAQQLVGNGIGRHCM